MGTFSKEPVHLTPHNINNSTLMINNEPSEGVDSMIVEYDTEDTDVESAADGMSLFAENGITSATITMTALEASPMSDTLWDLRETNASFPIALTDASAPKMKAKSAKCRFGKAPPVKREAKPDHVVYIFRATYCNIRGGSYTIVAD